MPTMSSDQLRQMVATTLLNTIAHDETAVLAAVVPLLREGDCIDCWRFIRYCLGIVLAVTPPADCAHDDCGDCHGFTADDTTTFAPAHTVFMAMLAAEATDDLTKSFRLFEYALHTRRLPSLLDLTIGMAADVCNSCGLSAVAS